MSATIPVEEMRQKRAAAESDLLHFEARAMGEITPRGLRRRPDGEPGRDPADAAGWYLARAREYRGIVGAWSATIARAAPKTSLTTH